MLCWSLIYVRVSRTIGKAGTTATDAGKCWASLWCIIDEIAKRTLVDRWHLQLLTSLIPG